MKKVNIGFDADKLIGTDAQSKKWFEDEGYPGIFEQYLNQGMNSLHPVPPMGQGVPLGKAKTLARIQNKLDDLPKDTLEVEFEEAEFDLLKSVFLSESVSFGRAEQVKLPVIYADAVEKATLEK